MKGLTKANCEKYGIRVAPEYDFTDDGSKFRGFIWNGIPMTQCRADGICYLAIRVDYLENNFTFKEWMETEEYILEDEFNGVEEFDINKLIENLKRIKIKIEEMNEECKEPSLGMKVAFKQMLRKDILEAEECMRQVTGIKWWRIDRYELIWFRRSIKELEERIEKAKTYDPEAMPRKSIKLYLEAGHVIDLQYIKKDIAKYLEV